ncbi:MAG: hypothetical protein ACTHXC_00270 [Brachybacterium sp.]
MLDYKPKVGDRVRITYEGEVREIYPSGAVAVKHGGGRMTDPINLDGKWSKKDLLSLPEIKFTEDPGWWRFLLIVPGPHKHDSGWAHIQIVGGAVIDHVSYAMFSLAYPDVIELPSAPAGLASGDFHVDAFHPQGVLRLWSNYHEFSVSPPTSSVDILVRRKEDI